MKKMFFISMIAMLFSACAKDQTAINNLSGSWIVKESSYQGSANNFVIGDRLIFYNCDVTKGSCSGTHITVGIWSGQTTINSFQYPVYNNGATFSIDYNSPTYPDIVDINIDELTTATLKFTCRIPSFGNATITLAKS